MDDGGKRVAWVELYLDLVFVLAVARLAHLIVAEPEMHSVWVALGLFFVLWWTWIGFAVLYNRRGTDTPIDRLLFLAASVPVGVAAVSIDKTAEGEVTAFVVAMIVIRLLLAIAHAPGARAREVLEIRSARVALTAAVLFGISLAVPEPFVYILWLIAISVESGVTLADDRRGSREARDRRDLAAMIPKDPAEALDAHHFAERFGLFIIISLGEILVEAGQASALEKHLDAGGWAALVAAMVFAGSLWWLYFDAVADFSLRVLQLSGGSPAAARSIFAVGHMIPTFALLIMAAGIGLLLEHEPPTIAYHLTCVGLGIYLLGTRVFLRARGRAGVFRALLLVATFMLARLHTELNPHEYVILIAAWGVMCAVLGSSRPARSEEAGDEREGVPAL